MKKQYFIILSIIVIVLLTANIIFLFSNRSCYHEHQANVDKNEQSVNCNCYVTDNLSLDNRQAKQYAEIKKKHQKLALQAIDSLHVSQEILMDYLASNENNQQKINELENRIADFQKQLLNQHVEQYQDLKIILKPEQIEPMNKLFKSLFVCQPSCNHKH